MGGKERDWGMGRMSDRREGGYVRQLAFSYVTPCFSLCGGDRGGDWELLVVTKPFPACSVRYYWVVCPS